MIQTICGVVKEYKMHEGNIVLVIFLLYFFVILIIFCITGFLTAYIAKEKEYPYGTWFAIGFLLGLFGLIAAAGLPIKGISQKGEVLKECPDCMEFVREKAVKCRYCGYLFTNKDQSIRIKKN
jgi:hypothetical protein